MNRLTFVLVLLFALLTTGCVQRIVAGKTIEESGGSTQVCVTYRYSGSSSDTTRTCTDDQGQPLDRRCYDDAEIGKQWPDSCQDTSVSDWTLTVRQAWRSAYELTVWVALTIGLIGGVYTGRRWYAPGWRAVGAVVMGAMVGLGVWFGTALILQMAYWIAWTLFWA